MDAETVDDLFGRERRDDRIGLVDATGREYDSHWLCTSAWKAGNFLRHVGVREGVTVGVVGDDPVALLAFFGTTLLEGTTRFEPPTDLADAAAFRALVAPVETVERYELPRGAQRIGYGSAPDAPAVHHFDAGLWSENPSFPPGSIDPETPVLTDGDRTVTHRQVVATAREVVEDVGLEADDRVVVREPLSDPRTIVAGVIAPLLVRGAVVLPADDGGTEAAKGPDSERGAYAVSGEPAPERHRIDLGSVSLP